MARPYFTGNYGSALARVDTRPIIESAQGQMYANMGAQIGGMIKEYGLNKQKRAKLTGEIEAYYEQNPEALSQIGMSGDEAKDKKDFTERERFVKGDMNMAQLEGLAGKLARGEVLQSKKLQDESRAIQNQLGEQNLGLQERLEDYEVGVAKDQSILSRLNRKLTQELDPKKRELLGKQIDETIADLSLRPKERKEREMQLRDAAGARASDPASIQARDDRKLRGLRIDAAEQGAEMFEAMGGVPGQVKRLEEDRELQKLQALGLYHARTNIGQSSPATVPIQKILSEAQKELERMGSLTTTLTDDNDKPLSVIDLLEVKPNREIGLKKGYDLKTMSPVTRNNVQLFLTQSGKVQDAQKQMPVPFQGTVDLTNFGSEPPKVGEIIDFNGQEARVVDITGGVVTVNYEGTLYEKNLLDMEVLQREEAARVDVPRFSPSKHVQNTYGM